MDELPELPFERVLGYLSLQDRLIKARAVSRRWYHKINSFPVERLYYSHYPIYRIRGAFAENFISSTQFATFFDTFGQTILSSLKHLRLCDLQLSERDRVTFARTLNSFGQLKQLDIIRVGLRKQDVFNLPMLTSLQLEEVSGIRKLTVEAPKLREIKVLGYYRNLLRLEIVHGESVERLLDWLECIDVKKLKNLRYLCWHPKAFKHLHHIFDPHLSRIDPTLLSSLQQLKEFHTRDPRSASDLFKQKQRSSRADLKIYFCGLLLNGSDDPAMNAIGYYPYDYPGRELLTCLAENRSRLADQIPFYSYLKYSAIEDVAPGLVDLLNSFTNLYKVFVDRPVQDTQCFLDLLKNCKNFIELDIRGDQPQDLFDRLPEYCAVQKLFIKTPLSNLVFLFRLKHLICLYINFSIDSETVRRALEELPVLSLFVFTYDYKTISIDQSKQFQVQTDGEETILNDLNAAIEFIFGTERPKKRRANDLE